jgi:hypothetical protein
MPPRVSFCRRGDPRRDRERNAEVRAARVEAGATASSSPSAVTTRHRVRDPEPEVLERFRIVDRESQLLRPVDDDVVQCARPARDRARPGGRDSRSSRSSSRTTRTRGRHCGRCSRPVGPSPCGRRSSRRASCRRRRGPACASAFGNCGSPGCCVSASALGRAAPRGSRSPDVDPNHDERREEPDHRLDRLVERVDFGTRGKPRKRTACWRTSSGRCPRARRTPP